MTTPDPTTTSTPETTQTTPASATETLDGTQPAPDAETSDQTGAPDAAETGEDEDREQRRNRVSFQDRISQLTSRRRLAERERDRALSRAQTAEAELARIQRLNPEQLSYDEREDLRLRRVSLDSEVRRARQDARFAEEDTRLTAEEVRQERNSTFVEKVRAAEKTNPGLYDRFNAIPVTESMAQFIAESDLGVELAHLLTTKEVQAEVDRIIDLTFSDPRRGIHPDPADVERANRMLARLEARVTKAPPARKTTTAPNPGTTLNGKTPVQTVSLRDLASREEGTAEYIRRRQEAWKKGGH